MSRKYKSVWSTSDIVLLSWMLLTLASFVSCIVFVALAHWPLALAAFMTFALFMFVLFILANVLH